METMRTLSLTMLLAGCGLHAAHIDPICESTQLGKFHLIFDYRGQQNTSNNDVELEQLSNESQTGEGGDESFSDSDYSDGYVSESFEEEPSIEEDAVQEPESEIEVERDVEIQTQSAQTDVSSKALAKEEQTQTTTVIESKRSVLPIVVGASAIIGAGCAVYKYVSAKKNNENKSREVKANEKK